MLQRTISNGSEAKRVFRVSWHLDLCFCVFLDFSLCLTVLVFFIVHLFFPPSLHLQKELLPALCTDEEA